jgi:predicted Zn-dependent protease
LLHAAGRPWRTLAIAGLLVLISAAGVLAGRQIWASYHFKEAQRAVEQYHTATARQHLEACLKVWPQDPETLLLAARVARRLAAFDVADQSLTQYRRVRGEDDSLILERTLLRAERGDVDAVWPFCHTLVTKGDPATPLILEALVSAYMRLYREREADYYITLWLEQQPDNCQALFLRARLHEFMATTTEAAAVYGRVLELDPERDDARLRLAVCLADLTQAAEAVPHLEHLLDRQPDHLMARVELARCQDLLGHQRAAEQILDEVLAAHPGFTPALTQRAMLAMRAGQLAEAEGWLRQASAGIPVDYQAQYQYELCLRLRGKAREAEKQQARRKQLDEDRARHREIMFHQMSLAPHDPSLHYDLGMIALREGFVPDGVRWLQSALRLDSTYAPAHRALASYYERIGQRGRALYHREQARSAAPEEPAKAAGR